MAELERRQGPEGRVGEEAEDNKLAPGLEPRGPEGEGRGLMVSDRLSQGTPERRGGVGAWGWPPEPGGSTKGQA